MASEMTTEHHVATDVPLGYKRTEVGVIPEDWKIESLGESCSLITKGTTPTSIRRAFTKTGIRFLKAESLSETGKVIPEMVAHIDPETHAVLHRSQLKEGDLLISIAGVLGRIGVVTKKDIPANTNQALAIVRVSQQSNMSRQYLFYALHGPAVTKRIHDINVQAAQANISLKNVSDLLIPVSGDKAEQRAIAEVLSDVDRLITALDKLIAKKRAIKQAAMQQLLTGKTRLPGFSREWGKMRLGNVCKITTGKKDVNEGNPDGEFPFFTCSKVHTYSDSFSFDTGAILVAGNGDVGNLHYFKGKFEAYQRTYVLSEFTINVKYLWYQLEANLIISLGIRTIGSSIPYIKIDDLINFEFNQPGDHQEQTAIAQVLSDMDAEIETLEKRRNKIKQIKQGMMQQLLTGRIRLLKPSSQEVAA